MARHSPRENSVLQRHRLEVSPRPGGDMARRGEDMDWPLLPILSQEGWPDTNFNYLLGQ